MLWDHGNGAKSIFFDELFDGDTLYLYELKQALAEGGVHLDTLILDACLMANLETAWNVKDYADYMVASEELVPGSGTAFGEWLNALVCHPTLDGQWLAKCVCDMTTVKYDNMEDEQSRSLLTWSVTDLSRIDRLIRACGDCIRNISSSLKDYPPLFPTQIALMTEGESFGEDRQKMLDLGGALFNDETCNFVDPRILDPVIDALSKAVIYLSRGQGRSKASGLTFCFLAGFSGEDLDLYARNFPMPSYLALLDAVSSWTAPEDVYTQAERLPEISGIERYRLKVEKTHTGSGIPAVSLTGPLLYAHYNLYRLDEETGETVFLGQANCGINDRGEERLAWAVDPMHWPALEGSLCCMSLVENNGDEILYNIPVQINTETAMLRCGRSNILEEDEIGENGYTVYGVWEGYDENSGLPGRSVKPLAMLAGQSYCMLYPRDGEMNSGTVSYLKGEKKTMYRSLRIKEEPLPAGTYWLEYQVSDLFMRVAKTDRIEIQWDGEKMSFPDGASWTGSIN